MPEAFAWDERKRISNLEKHGIDFRDAIAIFDYPHLTFASQHAGETRQVSLGRIGAALAEVVWTDRDGVVRIISARAARRNEREAYDARFRT
jgi:uncharacterized DUF497 family protein